MPRVNRGEIFSPLSPEDKGDYFECECPGCNNRTAFVYKNSTYLKCNRLNDCQYKTSIYDFMSGTHAPRGEAWWAVTEKLATMAGVTLPNYVPDEAMVAATEHRNELERLWLQVKSTMHLGEEYLAERGLMGAELGFIPAGSGPWIAEWYNRVVIPIRDRYSNLVGFVGRATYDAPKKYLYTQGIPLKEIGFIGLDVALKNRPDTMILVEGVIDRLRLNLAGVTNVVALGNASVSSDRFALLNEFGIRKVILALDNDEAGKRATREAVERAYDQLIPPEVLVHTYTYKDADEDLANGIAWDSVKNIPAHSWLAEQFIADYADTEEFVEAVIRFDERVTNPLRIAHLALHFFPAIEAHLSGLTEKPLMEIYSIRRQRNLQKKSNDFIQEAARRAKALGAEGDHEKAKEALFDGYRQSEAVIKSASLEPVRTLNERLSEHEAQILAYRGREILGLKTNMVQLTEALMGLRGLIFLGSAPNLGKTVLSVQLALQVLQNDPDTSVVYINLDMDTSDVITRIRCNIGEFEWKKFTQGHTIPIETGRDKVRQIGDRLVILDQRCFNGDVPEVIEIMQSLKAKTKTKRMFVVLDYVQVWEVPEDKRRMLRSEGDVDEWRVSIVKQLKANIDHHDAVLVISEVRKEGYNRPLTMEDLKGSSRLSYAGDIVLLLQRLTAEEYCEHFEHTSAGVLTHLSKRSIDSIGDVKEQARRIQEALEHFSITVGWLQVAKGRDGTQRKKIPVTAHFKLATIVEGFHIDGIPKPEVQENGHRRREGVDEGTLQVGAAEREGEYWEK